MSLMARSRKDGAAEAVIFGQSVLLMAVGFAGYLASDTVMSMADALQDKDSAAYFITDNAIVTDKTEISTEAAIAITSNFSLVCLVAFFIGAMVFSANVIRKIKN